MSCEHCQGLGYIKLVCGSTSELVKCAGCDGTGISNGEYCI